MEFVNGEQYPVDGILIKGNGSLYNQELIVDELFFCLDVLVDESSATGESDAIRKFVPVEYKRDEKASPFLFSGSKCMEGSGEMIVAAVGENSFMGKSKVKLQEETEPTPLQKKLERVADGIGKLGLWSAVVTFAVLTIFLIWETMSNEVSILLSSAS